MKLTRKIKIFVLTITAAVVLMSAAPTFAWTGHRHHYRPYVRPYYNGYYSPYYRPYYSPYYSYDYYRPYYPYYPPTASFGFGFPGFSFYVGP